MQTQQLFAEAEFRKNSKHLLNFSETTDQNANILSSNPSSFAYREAKADATSGAVYMSSKLCFWHSVRSGKPSASVYMLYDLSGTHLPANLKNMPRSVNGHLWSMVEGV